MSMHNVIPVLGSNRDVAIRFLNWLLIKPLILIIVVTVFLAGVWASPAFAAEGSLSGRVTDQAATPQQDVLIELLSRSDGTVAGFSTTDANGFYQVNLPVGIYDVRAIPPSSSSFRTVTIEAVDVSAGSSLNVILIPFGQAHVSGVVRDDSGNPVPDAAVVLGTSHDYTDSEGRYSVGVESGTYQFGINSNGSPPLPFQFGVTGGSVTVTDSDKVQDLTLATHRVTILVRYPDGSPVVGAQMSNQSLTVSGFELYPGAGDTGGGANPAGPPTDGDGRTVMITFPGTIREAEYLFLPDGSQTRFTIPPVIGDQTVAVTVPRTYRVTGVVRDDAGNPVPDAAVVLGTSHDYTDSEGRYSVGVESGAYQFGINSNGSPPLPFQFGVTGGSVTVTDSDKVQDLTLTTRRVTILVRYPDGSPVVGAQVGSQLLTVSGFELYPGAGDTGGGAYPAGPPTDADGRTVLSTLPGTIREGGFIFLPDGSQTRFTIPPIIGDQTVAVTVPRTYRVTGVVRDDAGNPVPDAAVVLGTSHDYTDSEGRYSVGVESGTYQFGINSNGSPALPFQFGVTGGSVTVTDSDKVQDLTLTTHRVTILVRYLDGSPVVGAQVGGSVLTVSGFELYPGAGDTGGFAYPAGPRTGSDGRTVMDTLPGTIGEAEALFLPDGSLTRFTIPPITSDQTVVVQLQPPSDITPPHLTLSGNLTVQADTNAGSSVTYVVTATDDRDGVLTPACSPTSGSNFPVGTTTVACTATDQAGNTAIGSFTVTVAPSADQEPPTVVGHPSPEPNPLGWNNGLVTVTWTAHDVVDGDLAPPPASTLSADGASQTSMSDQVCDHAGNCARGTVTGINIDSEPPVLGAPVWTTNPKPVGTSTVPASTTLSVPANDTLSGVTSGEYFIGTDPGAGHGVPMHYADGSLTAVLGANLPVGVYDIGVRAQDAAGNWTVTVATILVVHDPMGPGVTGKNKKDLIPSLAAGDTLPGLTAAGQSDAADYGFTVAYRNGAIDARSDFHFSYATGTRCNTPNPTNCHQLTIDALTFDWLVVDEANTSRGRFQGTARLAVDGIVTTSPFSVEVIDGDRLTPTRPDQFRLRIYPVGSNPATASVLYQATGTMDKGNAVRIR
jgi:protocatechuate 3,4-dioxygenase beta subunit